MKIPEKPPEENQRLSALEASGLLDTPPEERFDRITHLAAQLFDVPIALVSLIDKERQWFKSCYGLGVRETARDISFCGHAILGPDTFVVENALEDERFADNPLVTDDPDIRFYAGAPLTDRSGMRLGTLCLIDRKPRPFSEQDRENLRNLADMVEREIQLHDLVADVVHYRKTEQIKNEFISTVSHELRTPLTSIAGSLELVMGGATGPLPDKTEQMLAIARRNTNQLRVLIDDLLDIEKLISGKMVMHNQTQPLAETIQAAIEDIRPYAAQRNISVEAKLPEDNICANFDPVRLKQALANLLSNAVKFSPDGETVQVELQERDKQAVMTIKDRGPGIPEEFQPRVFQRFAQADSSSARSKEGTGLGLAITKELMAAMGGDVGFDSEVDQGTVFWIGLPLIDKTGS